MFGQTHDAALLYHGLVERVFLNRDVAPGGDEIPIGVFDLREGIRRIDERLRRVGVCTDHRELQLVLDVVHPGILQQRLRHGEVQRRLVIGVERIDDEIVVGSSLRDAGRPLQPIDGLTADAGLERVLMLDDIARDRSSSRGTATPMIVLKHV